MPASPRALLRTPTTSLRRRKSSHSFLLLLLPVVLLFPAAATAQTLREPDASAIQSPLEQLLEQRATLALTNVQLERLERIRQRLAASNDPLVNQMMDLRRQWQQQRRGRSGEQSDARLQEIRASAESIRANIQRNNKEAMQAVNRLLTPAQRTQLRTLVERRQRPATGAAAGTPRNGRD